MGNIWGYVLQMLPCVCLAPLAYAAVLPYRKHTAKKRAAAGEHDKKAAEHIKEQKDSDKRRERAGDGFYKTSEGEIAVFFGKRHYYIGNQSKKQ